MAMGKKHTNYLKNRRDARPRNSLNRNLFIVRPKLTCQRSNCFLDFLTSKVAHEKKSYRRVLEDAFLLSSPNENRNFLHWVQFRVKTKFLLLSQIHLSFECIEPEIEVEIHQRCSTAF